MQEKIRSHRLARAGIALMLAAGVFAAGVLGAQEPSVPERTAPAHTVPDTYTAVTTHMSPADVEIKADIVRWSSDEERAAAIAALAAEDPRAALTALPTAGVVWRSGSAVGHAIKYAHRQTAADGSETITLVTDRAIGSTSFTPWVADTPVDTTLAYSVVEMKVPAGGGGGGGGGSSSGGDGAGGEGTLSLGAELRIDAEAGTIALDRGARAALLKEVVKQPKPYWARSD